MHRETALYILTPILGAGGLACLAPGMGRLQWAGAGLMLAAAGAGLSAAVMLHRRWQQAGQEADRLEAEAKQAAARAEEAELRARET